MQPSFEDVAFSVAAMASAQNEQSVLLLQNAPAGQLLNPNQQHPRKLNNKTSCESFLPLVRAVCIQTLDRSTYANSKRAESKPNLTTPITYEPEAEVRDSAEILRRARESEAVQYERDRKNRSAPKLKVFKPRPLQPSGHQLPVPE